MDKQTVDTQISIWWINCQAIEYYSAMKRTSGAFSKNTAALDKQMLHERKQTWESQQVMIHCYYILEKENHAGS